MCSLEPQTTSGAPCLGGWAPSPKLKPASRPNWVAGGKGWKVGPPVWSSASAIAASTCAVAASAP
eukprot:12886903-Prorocentrum_lima.AAC.1